MIKVSAVVCFLILLGLLAPGPARAQDGKTAKVLITGVPGNIDLVHAWLEVDPLTDPRLIPSRSQDSPWTEGEILRFVRLYFPRSYKQLLEFEYIIMESVEAWVFTAQQQQMLYDSIYHGGLGGMQSRSVMSMHNYISVPWADSIVSDAFPNDADAVVRMDYTLHEEPMRVVINANPDVPPVFRPYKDLPGVEYSFGGAYGTNLAIPKEGAVVTSYSVGPYKYGFPGAMPDPNFKSPGWIPHSMYWKYGNGTTWTHQDMAGMYWNTFYNPYAPDMILAELIFSTGRKLPDDVAMVHSLRMKFTDYAAVRGFIDALLDFIDRFGANTSPVTQRMGQIASIITEAKQLYLDQEYLESSSTMDGALTDLDLLRDQAIRLKDRALLWIYVTEWFAVSGVFLVVGFTLWTLMVKRRLYREVKTTRLIGI